MFDPEDDGVNLGESGNGPISQLDSETNYVCYALVST